MNGEQTIEKKRKTLTYKRLQITQWINAKKTNRPFISTSSFSL